MCITDEDMGIRIGSFAIINTPGVSTIAATIWFVTLHHPNFQRTYCDTYTIY